MQEAFAPGAVAKRVAERHEISTGLLFTWRRQIMASARAGFVPVQVTRNADMIPPAVAASPRPAPAASEGVIEIDMPNGVQVRAGHGVDLKILRGVLAALDGRDAAGR